MRLRKDENCCNYTQFKKRVTFEKRETKNLFESKGEGFSIPPPPPSKWGEGGRVGSGCQKIVILPIFSPFQTISISSISIQGSTFHLMFSHLDLTQDHVLQVRMLWFFKRCDQCEYVRLMRPLIKDINRLFWIINRVFSVIWLMFSVFSMLFMFSHPGWQDGTICRALLSSVSSAFRQVT